VSIIALLQQSARGQVVELGNLPGTELYRNVSRFPSARRLPGLLIVRFGSSVNFVNRKSYKEMLLKYVQRTEGIHTVALIMSMANEVDTSGLNMLQSVTKILKAEKIQILLVGCRGPVRAFFQRSKFSDFIGMDMWFIDLQSAIDYLKTQEIESPASSRGIQGISAKRNEEMKGGHHRGLSSKVGGDNPDMIIRHRNSSIQSGGGNSEVKKAPARSMVTDSKKEGGDQKGEVRRI